MGCVDVIFIGATVILALFEFLLIFRFVEETKKDGSSYVLVLSSGRLITVTNGIKIIKRVAQSFESSGEDRHQVFIFSAAGKYWVSRIVPSQASTPTEA